jgi:hypothetical protein
VFNALTTTLGTGDSLVGGAGTDTLNVTGTLTAAASIAAASIAAASISAAIIASSFASESVTSDSAAAMAA